VNNETITFLATTYPILLPAHATILLTKIDSNPIYPHPFRRTKPAVPQSGLEESFSSENADAVATGFSGEDPVDSGSGEGS
jgi:hypothetical protein